MLDKKKVPRRFRRGLHGIAQRVDKRQITDGVDTAGRPKHKDCLNFVLDKLDEEDNIVDQISVELRAWRISGQVLNSGDEVFVLGSKNWRGFIVPQEIYVVNTGSIIAPDPKWGCLVGVLFVIVAVIIIFSLMGGTLISPENTFPKNNTETEQELIPSHE